MDGVVAAVPLAQSNGPLEAVVDVVVAADQVDQLGDSEQGVVVGDDQPPQVLVLGGFPHEVGKYRTGLVAVTGSATWRGKYKKHLFIIFFRFTRLKTNPLLPIRLGPIELHSTSKPRLFAALPSWFSAENTSLLHRLVFPN